jgi:hypothetical protein
VADRLPSAIDPVSGQDWTMLQFLRALREDFEQLKSGIGDPGGDDPGDPPPAPVFTFTATALGPDSIRCDWTTDSSAVTGWRLTRSGAAAEDLAATVLTRTFTGLAPETAYTFTLAPQGVGDQYVQTATATTEAAPLPVLTGSQPHLANLATHAVPASGLSGWGTLDGATDDGRYVAVTDHVYAHGAMEATANDDTLWVYAPSVNVTAGHTMTFAVDVWVEDAGRTAGLNLEYYTSSGGWVNEKQPVYAPLTPGVWNRVKATVTLPSRTGNVHPNPMVTGLSNGDIVRFTLADYVEGTGA